MMVNKTNISKFNWAESVSNPNGKTSGSKFNAHIVIVTCCICLIITVIRNVSDTLALAGILSGLITTAFYLLGYSKKKDTNDTTNTNIEENN